MFELEVPEVMAYRPDVEALRHAAMPKAVIAGADDRAPDAPMHWAYEGSQWLAGQLGVALLETPGAHAPMATHLDDLVVTLRQVLQAMPARSRVAAQPAPPARAGVR